MKMVQETRKISAYKRSKPGKDHTRRTVPVKGHTKHVNIKRLSSKERDDIMRDRSRRAVTQDMRKRGRIPVNDTTWGDHPGRYDLEGVDTPGSAAVFEIGDKVMYEGDEWEVGFVNESRFKGTVRLQKNGGAGSKQMNYVDPKKITPLVKKNGTVKKEPWEMTQGEVFDSNKIFKTKIDEQDALRKKIEQDEWTRSPGNQRRLDVVLQYPKGDDQEKMAEEYKMKSKQLSKEIMEWEKSYTVDDHRRGVEKAVSEGKPVPEKVLNDYPGIKPKKTGTSDTMSDQSKDHDKYKPFRWDKMTSYEKWEVSESLQGRKASDYHKGMRLVDSYGEVWTVQNKPEGSTASMILKSESGKTLKNQWDIDIKFRNAEEKAIKRKNNFYLARTAGDTTEKNVGKKGYQTIQGWNELGADKKWEKSVPIYNYDVKIGSVLVDRNGTLWKVEKEDRDDYGHRNGWTLKSKQGSEKGVGPVGLTDYFRDASPNKVRRREWDNKQMDKAEKIMEHDLAKADMIKDPKERITKYREIDDKYDDRPYYGNTGKARLNIVERYQAAEKEVEANKVKAERKAKREIVRKEAEEKERKRPPTDAEVWLRHAERPENARIIDETHLSKNIATGPVGRKTWMKNPGGSDIMGIDTPSAIVDAPKAGKKSAPGTRRKGYTEQEKKDINEIRKATDTDFMQASGLYFIAKRKGLEADQVDWDTLQGKDLTYREKKRKLVKQLGSTDYSKQYERHHAEDIDAVKKAIRGKRENDVAYITTPRKDYKDTKPHEETRDVRLLFKGKPRASVSDLKNEGSLVRGWGSPKEMREYLKAEEMKGNIQMYGDGKYGVTPTYWDQKDSQTDLTGRKEPQTAFQVKTEPRKMKEQSFSDKDTRAPEPIRQGKGSQSDLRASGVEKKGEPTLSRYSPHKKGEYTAHVFIHLGGGKTFHKDLPGIYNSWDEAEKSAERWAEKERKDDAKGPGIPAKFEPYVQTAA